LDGHTGFKQQPALSWPWESSQAHRAAPKGTSCLSCRSAPAAPSPRCPSEAAPSRWPGCPCKRRSQRRAPPQSALEVAIRRIRTRFRSDPLRLWTLAKTQGPGAHGWGWLRYERGENRRKEKLPSSLPQRFAAFNAEALSGHCIAPRPTTPGHFPSRNLCGSQAPTALRSCFVRRI